MISFRFTPALFPLALCILLGSVGFWLNRSTEISEEEIKLDPTRPQYIMQGIHAQQFDESGRLKNQLKAPKIWQLPEDKKIFFRQPEILTQENNRPLYHLKANQGVYLQDLKQVDLSGDVQLEKFEKNGRKVATMNTANLHIDEKNHSAETLAGQILQPAPNKRIKTVIYHVPQH
ncbi:MAG: LPS export ABC transporter periplasmic protein LptC [Neisseriaceae bacterium]|nr:LPS export ABC transporter periplasmic protein LptC [Neisseriaceae bacterium]